MEKPIDKLKSSGVNQQELRDNLINYLPKRFEFVLTHMRDNEYMESLTWALDRIDYHYRTYLKGHTKTLRNTFREFRLLDDKDFFLGLGVISEIGRMIEEKEYYELMERHNKAWSKICKRATTK